MGPKVLSSALIQPKIIHSLFRFSQSKAEKENWKMNDGTNFIFEEWVSIRLLTPI